MPVPAFSSVARPLAAVLAAVAVAGAAWHLLPLELPGLPGDVDPGVLVFFAPLCALVLAMLLQASWLIRNGLPDDGLPPARAIAHWQDQDD